MVNKDDECNCCVEPDREHAEVDDRQGDHGEANDHRDPG